MKHLLLTLLTILTVAAGGKQIRQLVVTPTPQMHCESCENKIKSNIRFEKGVINIETNIEDQTVTITYNAAKTNVGNLQAAMKKIGYETRVVSDRPVEKDKGQSRQKGK